MADEVSVVIVQLAGSPGSVYTDVQEAINEIGDLVRLMLTDEIAPAHISVRTGTMDRTALAELREFPGY